MRELTTSLLLLLTAAPAWPAPAALRPEPVAAGPAWEAEQFLGADPRGRVFVLRADTLDVYPLAEDGLGEPLRLTTSRPFDGWASDAAMGDDPGEWLVLSGFQVMRFDDGRDAAAGDLEWHPRTLGFQRGEPVAGVMPIRKGKAAPGFSGEQALPLVARFDGKEWDVLAEQPFADEESEDLRFRTSDLWGERTVAMASDRSGRLWVANGYFYRVRELSPGGRLLQDLSVGKTAPEFGDEEAARRKLTARLARQGVDTSKVVQAGSFTARRILHAVAPGRDGFLYLLVHADRASDRLALDRFDPARQTLERVPLTLGAAARRMEMVAGKDGLYLAGPHGRDGRWRLTWETLEQAGWLEVEGLRISGAAAEPAPAATEDKAKEPGQASPPGEF